MPPPESIVSPRESPAMIVAASPDGDASGLTLADGDGVVVPDETFGAGADVACTLINVEPDLPDNTFALVASSNMESPATVIAIVPAAFTLNVIVPNVFGVDNPPAYPAVFIRTPLTLSTKSYPDCANGSHPLLNSNDCTCSRFAGYAILALTVYTEPELGLTVTATATVWPTLTFFAIGEREMVPDAAEATPTKPTITAVTPLKISNFFICIEGVSGASRP